MIIRAEERGRKRRHTQGRVGTSTATETRRLTGPVSLSPCPKEKERRKERNGLESVRNVARLRDIARAGKAVGDDLVDGLGSPACCV